MTRADILNALNVDEAGLTEMLVADLRANGVLDENEIAKLPSVSAADIRVGDLVAIWAHQRYRAARVWKVGRKYVSAIYKTPSGFNPHNTITGKAAALLVGLREPVADSGAAVAASAVVDVASGDCSPASVDCGGVGALALVAGMLPVAAELAGHLF
jgi:hypothetical protein